ncbi:MAG: hypothetical protein ACOCQR_00855 [bacterium]
MRTRTTEVVEVKHYLINCENNDSVDIQCGGPQILGYDFFVDAEKNEEKTKKMIENMLKKYKQPLMNISVSVAGEIPLDNLWTEEKIENCIKKGY